MICLEEHSQPVAVGRPELVNKSSGSKLVTPGWVQPPFLLLALPGTGRRHPSGAVGASGRAGGGWCGEGCTEEMFDCHCRPDPALSCEVSREAGGKKGRGAGWPGHTGHMKTWSLLRSCLIHHHWALIMLKVQFQSVRFPALNSRGPSPAEHWGTGPLALLCSL